VIGQQFGGNEPEKENKTMTGVADTDKYPMLIDPDLPWMRILRWILGTGLWGEDLWSTSGLELWSQDAIGQAVRPDQ